MLMTSYGTRKHLSIAWTSSGKVIVLCHVLDMFCSVCVEDN